MSRINKIALKAAAENRKLLIPYLVAGDPNLETTSALMHKLVEQGADIIELGIPFSDPSSDGPVIQRGVERARHDEEPGGSWSHDSIVSQPKTSGMLPELCA